MADSNIELRKQVAQLQDMRDMIEKDLNSRTSLRDMFAGQAMQSLITKYGSSCTPPEIAWHAYEVSSAMIKESKKLT